MNFYLQLFSRRNRKRKHTKKVNLVECPAQTVWLQIIIKPSYKYHKSITKVICMTHAL